MIDDGRYAPIRGCADPEKSVNDTASATKPSIKGALPIDNHSRSAGPSSAATAFVSAGSAAPEAATESFTSDGAPSVDSAATRCAESRNGDSKTHAAMGSYGTVPLAPWRACPNCVAREDHTHWQFTWRPFKWYGRWKWLFYRACYVYTGAPSKRNSGDTRPLRGDCQALNINELRNA